LSFGDPASFGFDLEWSDGPAATAAERTRGKLRLWVASRSVWGESGGLEWTWVELLEHLARFWPYLILEEMDPLGLALPAESLWVVAQERWHRGPEANRATEQEEESLHGYLEAHDLAAGLAGVFPPSVYFTREGASVRVAARGSIVRVPLNVAEQILTALGETIAGRLVGHADPRASLAVARWSAREALAPGSLLGTATGIDEHELALTVGDVDPSLLDSSFDDLRGANELVAAARMSAGAVPPAVVRELLVLVTKQPRVWTNRLDVIAQRVAEAVRGLDDSRPWEQGYRAAGALRELLGVAPSARVDPAQTLADWGIPVREERLPTRLIDALSVWGPRHGPAIVLNRNGKHGRLHGARATLAHEIAHLLLDRSASLPVGEVLGGRVPSEIEQRAKSFAAEFLLPRSVAYERALEAADMDAALRELSDEYGASREIAAWQIRNGAAGQLLAHHRAVLRGYVSEPQAF
jgi:hypothetical protein